MEEITAKFEESLNKLEEETKTRLEHTFEATEKAFLEQFGTLVESAVEKERLIERLVRCKVVFPGGDLKQRLGVAIDEIKSKLSKLDGQLEYEEKNERTAILAECSRDIKQAVDLFFGEDRRMDDVLSKTMDDRDGFRRDYTVSLVDTVDTLRKRNLEVTDQYRVKEKDEKMQLVRDATKRIADAVEDIHGRFKDSVQRLRAASMNDLDGLRSDYFREIRETLDKTLNRDRELEEKSTSKGRADREKKMADLKNKFDALCRRLPHRMEELELNHKLKLMQEQDKWKRTARERMVQFLETNALDTPEEEDSLEKLWDGVNSEYSKKLTENLEAKSSKEKEAKKLYLQTLASKRVALQEETFKHIANLLVKHNTK